MRREEEVTKKMRKFNEEKIQPLFRRFISMKIEWKHGRKEKSEQKRSGKKKVTREQLEECEK